MIRIAQPAHPGQFIRMEIIQPLGLSVTEAAKVLGVTRPALSALLNARAALSPFDNSLDPLLLRRDDADRHATLLGQDELRAPSDENCRLVLRRHQHDLF